MKRLTGWIFLLLLLADVHATQPLDSLLAELSRCVDQSDVYISRKEEVIRTIKTGLDKHSVSPNQRFDSYTRLFREYRSYKYDSAYVYANKSLETAIALNNNHYVIEAKEAITFCLLSSGLFKEAFDLLEQIPAAQVPVTLKKEYYSLLARLYYDLADYNREEPYKSQYIEKGNRYSDSLLNVIPKGSKDWWYSYGLQEMKKRHFQDAITAFSTLLNRQNIDDHTCAIAASSLGYVYSLMGDKEMAKRYLAIASMGDIRSATKETTALRNLANLLYESGQINLAYKYIKLAMEDANFYNARHRKIEISSILPIIEKERFEILEKQRDTLMWSVTSISLLFILLLVATIVIYKQMKKLKRARQTIGERNTELQQTNTQLNEVSNIKDEYIGYSFYLNAEYIGKMESLYKIINRKIAARQYDDLRTSFKESDLRKERENMYISFDETFLKLFPSFIQAYNKLFRQEDITWPESSKILTPEMRIFALIRLGIDESERIANFLNYSVNTINTYKTKVKNKSIVPNEQFEQRILEIKSVNPDEKQGK